MRLLAYDCSRFVLASSVILSPVMSSKYCRLSVPFRFSPCSNRVDVRGDIFFAHGLWCGLLFCFLLSFASRVLAFILFFVLRVVMSACSFRLWFVPVVCLFFFFVSCDVLRVPVFACPGACSCFVRHIILLNRPAPLVCSL